MVRELIEVLLASIQLTAARKMNETCSLVKPKRLRDSMKQFDSLSIGSSDGLCYAYAKEDAAWLCG